MRSLGRRYVAQINATYQRSGTLWERRYKSCLVDSERHVLTCYRYIELNPVRAAMVAAPDEYRWSSYNVNALGKDETLVTTHSVYLRMGRTREQRAVACRDLFRDTISEDWLHEIRTDAQQQRALGTNRIQTTIEEQLIPQTIAQTSGTAVANSAG
jgi:putative transposase